MKKSVYKSAMNRVKTSENFKEATYLKLMREMEQSGQTAPTAIKAETNKNTPRETMKMENTLNKRKLTGWTAGIAACAVLAVGLIAWNPNETGTPVAQPTPSAIASKPPILGKVAVNIDGVITEVSADGKSFKIGDLWVEVTDQTRLGSNEPTAEAPSEELLQKDFAVGNIVSGYTSQDVATGKVTADVIYNNIAPQPDGAASQPAVTGKAMVNIDGVITEVAADGKSFKVGDLWVTVTPDTMLGIPGPTAGEPSDELLQKEFKVGNIVSGFTSEDVSTGKVNATRIYNNMAPQQ